MRKLSLVIAGILGAGTPLISQAATLGEARVQSYLSQPLDVRVPLARSSDEPLDEITVKLAPPSFYREAGVPLENITGNLTFRIESDRGQDYVLIGSKRPIRDPILSILLEIDSPQGRMIREYNLLLDPPSMGSGQQAQAGEATAANQAAAAVSAPRSPSRSSPGTSAWQRVEPAQDVSLDGTRDVQSGDTLYEIARDYVADGADVRPMMQAIIDANPQAFANGNGNALMAGARLRVPDSGASATGSDQAETDGSGSDTATAIERLPALELLGPEAGGEQTAAAPANLGGFGDLTREQPLAAIADGTQPSATQQTDREAALDQEEVESVRAENEALTDQLRALKDQIDTVKVAVDERDAQIAELQDVIEQSRAELAAAERSAGNFWMEWGKYLTGALGLVIIALLIALALRRNRRDEEAGVPMPVTADASSKRSVDHEPIVEPAPTSTAASTVAGPAAAATAASGMAYAESESTRQESTSEPASGTPAPASGMDDPMNPEMALEEARVLESFNLTHQAVELLQDSLAEHPGHSGLQAALNRLKGIDAGESADGSQPQDDAFTPMAETDESDASSDATTAADDVSVASDAAGDQEANQPQAPADADWDDDLDDMLATPEPDTSAVEDESMEFDDSFALETPVREAPADHAKESGELELPENEAPVASVETPDSEAGEPEPLDLDLSGYEPAGEPDRPEASSDQDEGMDLDLGETPAADEPVESEAASEATAKEASSAGDDEANIDTRVELAEAFLDVGDRESFDMIEAELQEEGATAALKRLEELKKRSAG
ncbi:FimV/HubP family polar landmark protein [Guyparkeria halophila]|uniref:FimV/HubP family polar landmark protein n=1 Tax=Guyparkeria halophila TaxID=47960 RepID=A0ABZ0YVW5_9GAMM|nr:FimV/HubP family polar landmark protein [Guyparkeria halophila]WQH15422.1 FimV/HubP family polar landmark protein [Guyparkeria halophila]